jgi:DNA-binding CsgD family transcriptional regulator/tetratricopeptide (TPR) repeat protein
MNALLERERELEVLTSATADAARGSGALVLVHGEPGIGKTSLIRAYLSRLKPDTRTFVGVCDDLITPRTLGPFHDAVRWRGGPLAEALHAGGDRDRVFNAVIEELSHPSDVTVVVVEDVHWADDATLDVLQFVARRIDSLRALVVLTYRDADLRDAHPLRSMLGSAAGRAVRHIAVPRLSPDAVGVLSAATDHDAEAVFAVTAGNAFFVTELLAGGGDTPATVVDAVLARMRQLEPATQRALEQLSVVPTRVEHRLVEALVGQLDSLAEAEQRGILRVGREHVAFRHELARRAIEQSLPHARRVALNRTVTAALLDSPEQDLARVLHHAVQAGDVDTIIAYGHTAGRDAARAGSHQQALTYFEQVLLHEGRLPAEELPVLLEEYAWELYNAHRFVEAARTANRSCSLFRELGDPRLIGTALVTLSRHLWMSGDVVGAWAALDEATELLDQTDDLAARAQAHTYRGAVLALQEEVDEALPQLMHGQAPAEEAGSDSLVALCLNYRGICAMERRQESEAIALLRESLARARQAHDSGSRSDLRTYAGEHIARAYTNLAATLHIVERFDELEEVLAEALPYVIDHDFSSHYYNLEIRRCAVLISRGQLLAAEAALRELDRAVDDPGVLGRYMLPMFARLLARRGDPDAEFVLERASVYADKGGVLGIVVDVALAAIEWAWLSGQPHKAAPRVVDVLSRLDPALPWHRRMLGEVLRYAKRAGLADGEAFDGCPEPWAAALRGNWFAAATQFQARGNDYERALELAESGDVAVMASAIELLDKLGADAAAALVRRRMRGLGVMRVPRRPMPATRANPAGLTERQVDVLRLLREGLTNAEIADRLVLSVRTVDHHVAAILDKLQVPSRRSAAERAVELGIG